MAETKMPAVIAADAKYVDNALTLNNTIIPEESTVENTVNATSQIALTVLCSTKSMSKRYSIDENDDTKLIKQPAIPFSKGTGTVKLLDNLEEFACLRNSLDDNSATCYGVIIGAEPDVAVQMASEKNLANTPGAVARCNESMQYDSRFQTILFLDFDNDKVSGLSVEEKKRLFLQLFPQFEMADHVESPSSSSYLYNDFEERLRYSELTGIHYYVAVKTDEMKAITEIISCRLALAGRYWTVVSSAGVVLLRTLVDTSVFNQPCRLDYPSRASTKIPVVQNENEAIYTKGEEPIVELSMFEPLTDEERQKADAMLAALKKERENSPEVQEKKAERVKDIVAARTENNAVLAAEYTKVYEEAQNSHVLSPDLQINLQSGETVTVAQILDNPRKYDKYRCADPFDASYEDSRCCQLNTEGTPNLYNYHTDETYFLSEPSCLFGSIKLPDYYNISLDGEIWYSMAPEGENSKYKPVFVSYTPVAVTSVIESISDGTQKCEVTFLDNGVKKKTVVNRDTLAGKTVTSLASYGLLVDTGNQKALSTYFTAQIKANPQLPRYIGIKQLGFLKLNNEYYFVTGEGCVGKDGYIQFGDPKLAVTLSFDDEETRDTASNIRCSGSKELWVREAKTLNDYPYAKIIVAAAAVSPFIGKLGIANFVVNMGFQTSTGKTTAQIIAASIAGNPERLIITWNNTKAGLEHYLTIFNNIATLMDDTKNMAAKRSEDVRKTIRDVIYEHSEGKGRGRSNITRGIQKVSRWKSVLITSSEEGLLDAVNDGGAVARVLDLKGLPFNNKNEVTRQVVNRYQEVFSENYGWALVAIVSRFMSSEAVVESYQQKMKNHSASLDKYLTSGVGDRLSKYAAAVLTGIDILNDSLELDWSCDDVEKVLIDTCVRQSTELSEGERALSYVVEYAESHKTGVMETRYKTEKEKSKPDEPSFVSCCWQVGYKGGYAGYVGESEIGLIKTALKQILEEGNFSLSPVESEWLSRGWLKKETRGIGKDGKPLYDNPQFRIGSSRMRHVTLNSKALAVAHGEPEPPKEVLIF